MFYVVNSPLEQEKAQNAIFIVCRTAVIMPIYIPFWIYANCLDLAITASQEHLTQSLPIEKCYVFQHILRDFKPAAA